MLMRANLKKKNKVAAAKIAEDKKALSDKVDSDNCLKQCIKDISPFLLLKFKRLNNRINRRCK